MEGEGRGLGKEPSSSLYTLRYVNAQEDAEGWRGRGRGRNGARSRSPLVPSTLSGM
jgi:hypothetical protein